MSSQSPTSTTTSTTYWKQTSNTAVNASNNSMINNSINAKFPGRVIMKQQNNNHINNNISKANSFDNQKHLNSKQLTASKSQLQSHSTTTTATPHQSSHQSLHHKRNNSASFEVFTASCADAWDSNIDECVANCMSQLSTDSGSVSPTNVNIKEMPPVSTSSSKTESTSNSTADKRDKPVDNSDPKLAKFNRIIFADEVTDLCQLRSLAWAGIPNHVRPITWKLLLGYLPVIRSKRPQVMERKRAEYQNLVQQYYNNRQENDDIWRQIHIDIPRMQPLISIFQQNLVQGIFERILYIWSIRHPASGYVQGMNDLVTPFFVTYLSEFIPGNALSEVESFEVCSLTNETLSGIEADVFWSFTKLLDSIQDNYTFAQPGIQHLVHLLSSIVSRIDPPLHEHLERHSVQYLQFAFRWMNNLLIRELPLRCIVRLWDTYLAEGAVATTALPTTNIKSNNEFSVSSSTARNSGAIDANSWTMGSGTPFSSAFHLFVCAAFLRFFSKNLLQEKDFQGLMLLLQNLPTFHWTDIEVRLLVADAYQLKYTFSPNHLKV